MPCPELSPLRDGLLTKRQVASTSPEARTTLRRLKKARAFQPQPEMSSTSDELEFNQQPSTFWQVKANRAHSHNTKKSLNGNKTVTCYEYLNANLRLVLITDVSMSNSDA